MDNKQPDWSKDFEAFLASPLGKELIRTLKEDLHDTTIDKAEAENASAEHKLALLNIASGVTKVIEHLHFRSK